MNDDRERIVYRFGSRTPCCGYIVRHVDPVTILCRGCGTLYTDATALICEAFPGAEDRTNMTPERWK